MAAVKTTLSEISKALDFSISTISKALSDSPEISESTKTRVKEYAQRCNYVPNKVAAGLRNGKTNTIGLVIPHVFNPFFATILTGIEDSFDKYGYSLITAISNESSAKEFRCIEKMGGGHIDGLIFWESTETELSKDYSHIHNLIRQGIPVVGFNSFDVAQNQDSNNETYISSLFRTSVDELSSIPEPLIKREQWTINSVSDGINKVALGIAQEATSLLNAQINQSHNIKIYNKITVINTSYNSKFFHQPKFMYP